MTRLFLAAGVAALAITAPAASQPGDRGGKDRRAEVQKERAEKALSQRAERRQATEQRAQRAERREARAPRVQRAQREERTQRAQRIERSQAQERRAERVQQVRAQERRAERVQQVRAQERRADRVQQVRAQERRADRVQQVRAQERRAERAAQIREQRVASRQRAIDVDRIKDARERRLARIAETRVVPLNEWRDLARGGVWLDGCPPGLARKPVPCVPPGQVKNLVGQPLNALRQRVELQELPSKLRYAYRDTDDYYYRYGNGYMYQVNREDNLIRSLLPLFGLGMTVGQPFPASYSNYYLPSRLQPFYADSPYTSYRYANGYVYQIDPLTGLIEDVDPMLGYGYGYGQMMPATYSAYNVPYQYRPLYYDTSDSYYRYAPGAIYQVDPTTSLITAVAALLTGGMTVGQPLPTGYGAYNLPYDYRTQFYDTPNDWYRYSNGYIYRVDPATQLVTAIVASALT